MADVYGKNLSSKTTKPSPTRMLLVGRITMIRATASGLYFARGGLNILGLLVFVEALAGALVFPVIASFYWPKVTNKAFTASVLGALASAPFVIGFVHDYTVVTASLAAYPVSTIVCCLMSVRSTKDFDFEIITQRVGDYDPNFEPVDASATE